MIGEADTVCGRPFETWGVNPHEIPLLASQVPPYLQQGFTRDELIALGSLQLGKNDSLSLNGVSRTVVFRRNNAAAGAGAGAGGAGGGSGGGVSVPRPVLL